MIVDFFDTTIHFQNDSFRTLLQQFSHQITDTFGNVLSSGNENEIQNKVQFDISVEGQKVAEVVTDKNQEDLLKKLIEHHIQTSTKNIINDYRKQQDEIIAQDIEALLYYSENETFKFSDLLKKLLKLLQSNVLVENASIFGIYDGVTLQGLAGISPKKDDEVLEFLQEDLSVSSLAGHAATKRKPYVCEDPANDPNYSSRPDETPPKNLVCYPLLHGETLVGVLNLSNKLGGTFTDNDMYIIKRFARIGAHLLQKQFFKEKMLSFEKTSDHLGKYLSSKVVKNVKTSESIELGGIEKKVVCLFSDIRNFTTITEGLSPVTLVKLLNFFFERMGPIIDKHEGTLDKIVGDLLMVVWNIPLDQPEPEHAALRCAMAMQKEMIKNVAPVWHAHGVPEIGCGIGINSGLAVVGNLGCSSFMNYTVVGDTINTAQRLESQAKSGEIWIAEQMYEELKGKVPQPLRKERNIKLKGKEHSVNAYVFKPSQI